MKNKIYQKTAKAGVIKKLVPTPLVLKNCDSLWRRSLGEDPWDPGARKNNKNSKIFKKLKKNCKHFLKIADIKILKHPITSISYEITYNEPHRRLLGS